MEEKAGGHRAGVFWVALDLSAAEVGDQIDCAGQARREHTLAAVGLDLVGRTRGPESSIRRLSAYL